MTEFEKYESLFKHAENVYVYACYLPPSKTNIMIKPGSENITDFDITYQTFFVHPRQNNIPIGLKQVKKI